VIEKPGTFIRGKVVYGGMREPLPGIRVVASIDGVASVQRWSDSDGGFDLRLPLGGNWRVTVFPFGQEGIRPTHDVEVADLSEANIEIVVPDRVTYDIHGQVTDEDGQGIAKVNVRAWYAILRSRKRLFTETTTGPGGHYQITAFEIPVPRPPESRSDTNERERFPRHTPVTMARTRHYPHISLYFDHPDYSPEFERLVLSDHRPGRVKIDAILTKPGYVDGILIVPGGESLDGKVLPFHFERAEKPKGSYVIEDQAKVVENTFRIRIPAKGRLTIGGKIGRFVAEEIDLGMLDKSTRKTGVEVVLKSLKLHSIRLLDQNGTPIPEGAVNIFAEWESAENPNHRHSVEIDSGCILVPIPFTGTKILNVIVDGQRKERIKITEDDIPESVTIQILPPLLVGRILLPAGYTNKEEIHVKMSIQREGGGQSRMGPISFFDGNFDPENGEFRFNPFYNADRNSNYTIIISIPGYKPWEKKNVCLQEGKSPESVVVTFQK
jgi:hypothetical protein